MTIFNKNNSFTKMLFGVAVLLVTFLFSCNNSSKDETKTVTAPADSTMMQDSSHMKMSADSSKMMSDTSGKGGQPTPIGH